MLIVIGIIGAWTLRKVHESDRWVDHTREVIRDTDVLLSSVKDAESGQRGYLLTGEPSYLQPYYDALRLTPERFDRLKQLTSDNSQQQARLDALQPLITERLTSLGDVIRAQNESGLEAARRIILAGRGRYLMGAIEQLGQKIQNEEYALLAQRSQSRLSSMRNGFAASVIASLLAFAALLSAPFDVRRAVKLRRIAEQRKSESESRARALFEAAAQAIFIVRRDGTIVMANPSAERILGYSAQELLGKSVEELLPEALGDLHREHRERYFENPQNRSMGLGLDLYARRKDGSEFFADISLSYIRTAQETLAVAFLTDISKRRADEQAIGKQKDDLRLLAGRMMTAQDDERRRIARDLHDDLSQKLAYLAMDIGKMVAKTQSEGTVNDLRQIQARAMDAAESVRQISHQLHPSILDDIGLEAALEQYCEEFQERSGIVTHFSSSGVPDSLPKDVASSVYHIFQECLRNVSKHAKTEEVSVTLDVIGGYLRLAVKDEGIGLPEIQLKTGSSIGLIGMKERALLVNGTLTIRSESGEGTEVTVAVPIVALA